MSRTFRTNKYGKIKTDKFVRKLNDFGYCKFINRDNRNKYLNKYAQQEIEEDCDYLDTRCDEHHSHIDDEGCYLDNLSLTIMNTNKNK